MAFEKTGIKTESAGLLTLLEELKAVEIIQCGLARHTGHRVECYVQRDCWSLHFYHYHGSLGADGHHFDFGPNSVSLIPPACAAEWSFPGIATHYYVHFRLEGVRSRGPAMCFDAFKDEPWLRTDLEFIGANYRRWVRACELRLQNLLWRLALGEEGGSSGGAAHPVLQIAESIIRNELDRTPRVAELARRCNVSEGHLNRLFRQAFHESTQAYLQRQRLQTAEHLLRNSCQPILSIARQVGFDDLQAFNKFVRKRLGAAPRTVRLSQINLRKSGKK